MKHFFTIILTIVFYNSTVFSQCEVPGGDFEEFVDISSEFEYYVEGEITEPILISSHFIGGARTLFLSLEAFFSEEPVGGNFYRQVTGQYQYQPGANETASAIQLKPDTLLQFVDALATFNCDSLPIALKGSYLHVGQATDSAYISIAFGDSILSDSFEVILGGDTTFMYAQIGASGELAIGGGENMYTEFEVPITNLENGISTDSVLLTLNVISDTTYLKEGNESYYVYDEFSFVYDEQVAVNQFEVPHNITVFPNPAFDFIYISYSEKNMGDIKVFDQAGRLVQQESGFNFANRFGLSELDGGIYFLDIHFDDFNVRKKIIKM